MLHYEEAVSVLSCIFSNLQRLTNDKNFYIVSVIQHQDKTNVTERNFYMLTSLNQLMFLTDILQLDINRK